VPDFHAVQVMAAILGGLFNSRLQLNLREDKGYTYGVGAGFDMRRGGRSIQRADGRSDRGHGAGHRRISGRAAPDARHARHRRGAGGGARLHGRGLPTALRDAGAVVGAVGGLFVGGLPDDELARYRGLVEAVTAADVRKAAQDHIHPDRLAIVLVGDADVVAKDLDAAGFGDLEVICEELPGEVDGAGEAAEEDE